MLTIEGLDPVAVLAMVSAVKGDELDTLRDMVKPSGVPYKVDSVVRIQGLLSVAPETFANNPNSLNLWALVAVLADRLRGDSFETIVKDLCARQQAGEDLSKLAEGVKPKTQALMKELLGSTRVTRRGQVQFEGTARDVARKPKKNDHETVDLFAAHGMRKKA